MLSVFLRNIDANIHCPQKVITKGSLKVILSVSNNQSWISVILTPTYSARIIAED